VTVVELIRRELGSAGMMAFTKASVRGYRRSSLAHLLLSFPPTKCNKAGSGHINGAATQNPIESRESIR